MQPDRSQSIWTVSAGQAPLLLNSSGCLCCPVHVLQVPPLRDPFQHQGSPLQLTHAT